MGAPDLPALILPRRGLLTRALGFTAAGAALALPMVAVETPEARLKHHLDGAAAAFRELFPGTNVELKGNVLDGHHGFYQEAFAEQRPRIGPACALLFAAPPAA